MHVNVFDTKTNDELFVLYNQFLEAEKISGFSNDNELGEIKKEYEKDFGVNAVLILQIELTHTIANRWFTKNETKKLKGEIKMKKEIIGYVRGYNDNWSFETDEENYSANVPTAIDELLDIDSRDGDKFKITIEKLN